jgi:hypothetical protein
MTSTRADGQETASKDEAHEAAELAAWLGSEVARREGNDVFFGRGERFWEGSVRLSQGMPAFPK